MTNIDVFAGPSLPHERASALLPGARIHPPVTQGDVASVLRNNPTVIVIIDGLFGSVPSVWHKEILLALDRGVRVVGAASMGALRAAELCSFGMEGVGEIFKSYRDGEIEADDEVAVYCATEELGWRALTEPLVNIRVTFREAVRQDVITEAIRYELIRVAQSIYFGDRTYDTLLAAAVEAGVARAHIQSLQAFLKTNAIDQKRLDAEEALRHVQRTLSNPLSKSEFELQTTCYLNELLDSDVGGLAGNGYPARKGEVVAEASRCLPDFPDLCARATERRMAHVLANALGLTLTEEELQIAVNHFRRKRGLTSREDTLEWLKQNDLTIDELADLVQRDELAARARALFDPPRTSAIIDQLCLEGRWGEVARMLDKPLY